MEKSSQSGAEILPTDTSELFEAAVRRATDLLRAGQVVALPTETVYGLAANALDPQAVARVFEVKGRPANNPIIAHVATLEMARRCASHWPGLADKLAQAFWPGPLTLVVPRAALIPDILTAGGPTVGIRWPSHPFIQAVIQRCGFPLAAPSANLSNRVSPTNAGHVLKQLGRKIPLIVDGGQAQVGIESTVLDVSVQPPRVLRPGMIHDEALLTVTGELEVGSAAKGGTLKSPGMLLKHYAPRARLVLARWQHDGDLESQARQLGTSLRKIHIIAHTHIPSTQEFASVNVIPHDPEAFARAIYAQLHECDDAGAEVVMVESLPDEARWKAVADRLNRAAST
ncbi:MAG TPA: L-threonylcarbamoyladenylate synthase [Verrucomicrobiae bacterium]|nr:L-threonylcarbamoyladenylate synthase [Verrucomicrobiae bacterium]